MKKFISMIVLCLLTLQTGAQKIDFTFEGQNPLVRHIYTADMSNSFDLPAFPFVLTTK